MRLSGGLERREPWLKAQALLIPAYQELTERDAAERAAAPHLGARWAVVLRQRRRGEVRAMGQLLRLVRWKLEGREEIGGLVLVPAIIAVELLATRHGRP